MPSDRRDQWTGLPEDRFFTASDFTVWVIVAGWPSFFTRKECIDFGLLPMSQEEARRGVGLQRTFLTNSGLPWILLENHRGAGGSLGLVRGQQGPGTWLQLCSKFCVFLWVKTAGLSQLWSVLCLQQPAQSPCHTYMNSLTPRPQQYQ